MKALKNIFLIIALSSVGAIMSCGGGDSAGPTDESFFVGTWTANSVLLDNFDVTEPEYANFSVTFNTDGSYITTDGDPVFTDTGGFWTISSRTDNALILNVDGVTMQAEFGEGNSTVVISFTAADEAIGARTSGLTGQYVFTLSKQQ